MSCAVGLYDAECGYVGCLGVGDVEGGADGGVGVSCCVVSYDVYCPCSVFVLDGGGEGEVVLYASVGAVVYVLFEAGSVRIGDVDDDFFYVVVAAGTGGYVDGDVYYVVLDGSCWLGDVKVANVNGCGVWCRGHLKAGLVGVVDVASCIVGYELHFPGSRIGKAVCDEAVVVGYAAKAAVGHENGVRAGAAVWWCDVGEDFLYVVVCG